MKEKVNIRCHDSVILEGALEFPESTGEGIASALICHPHPLYGGDMNNNVVSALSRMFVSSGIAALRFNFRGVGQSSGSYGEGFSEMIDVASCIDFLVSDKRLDSSKILLGGYSFGSWVAMKTAVSDNRPSRLFMISPPVDMYDFSFLSSEKRPKLMITGDSDFVCSMKRFDELSLIVSDPKICKVLEGHDHFHWSSENEITNVVRDFLSLYPM